MKTWLLPLVMLLAALNVNAQTAEIKSPDGQVSVIVFTEEGKAFYTISLDGQPLLLPSRLGLVANYANFADSLTLKEWFVDSRTFDYTMTRTKASTVNFNANVLVANFQNARQQKMSLELVVSNRDVALRYHVFPQEERPKSAVVQEEVTSFNLPEGTTTFLSPQSHPMIGWERTKPSYEEVYGADRPMAERSFYGHGYVFPALFHVGASWVLISETGVNGKYVGSHLSDWSAQTGYTIAFPMEGENNGIGTTTAGIVLPGTTPWRTITIGKTLKPIVETTISYDLVDPLFSSSHNYLPGRYTWSWLIGQDESINYDDQKRYIDLAADMGFEYCLVDNWWDQRIGRDKIEELSKYARQKGVSLMLWYNSNGFENDAPQTPRQLMNTPMARDKEMAWLQDIGVKGIKVDFFGGDKQQTMQLYEDILYDANRYGLQVIFHGCTLPRGWERMYPNFVASEAVLASENVMFTEGNAKREAFDLTLHPFCRNSTASMDWGGIIMNRHMSLDNRSRHARHTTDIFELASGITMQTAIQCVAMQPNNLTDLQPFELEFLKQLPTTWDETLFLDGYPGRFVVMARRHGSEWYVAGLNAEPVAKKLTLSLPMLAGQTVSYYKDTPEGTPVLTTLKIDKKGRAKIEIQPNGGIILK